MQTAYSKIWTPVNEFISNDVNHYPHALYQEIDIYVL